MSRKDDLRQEAIDLGLGLAREDGKDKTIKELEAEIAANTPETNSQETASSAQAVESVGADTVSDVAEEIGSGYDLGVFEGNAAVDAIAKFRNTGDGSALEALLDKATGK